MANSPTTGLMAELNPRFSMSTANRLWTEKYHNCMRKEYPEYEAMFTDTIHLIESWNDGDWDTEEAVKNRENAYDIAIRLFYILTMSPIETVSLATVVSKLETDCVRLGDTYPHNIQLYAELVLHLEPARIFTYRATRMAHPILTPRICVPQGELRDELEGKFAAALPQLGHGTGELSDGGKGFLPGVRFTGKSTKRKTPLNEYDRAAITLVSQQAYTIAHDIVESMEYHVPSMTDLGQPLTPKEREDAKTSYNRFADMAVLAKEHHTVLQFPTTQDSRGRFYNAATDPAVRLSLRSIISTGKLTPFEIKLLN